MHERPPGRHPQGLRSTQRLRHAPCTSCAPVPLLASRAFTRCGKQCSAKLKARAEAVHAPHGEPRCPPSPSLKRVTSLVHWLSNAHATAARRRPDGVWLSRADVSADVTACVDTRLALVPRPPVQLPSPSAPPAWLLRGGCQQRAAAYAAAMQAKQVAELDVAQQARRRARRVASDRGNV